jgi:hypothetical protein
MPKRIIRISRNVPLDVLAVEAHVRYWQKKVAAAATERDRAFAEGSLNAWEIILVVHGVPVPNRKVA